MKIFVLLKQVPDTEAVLAIRQENSIQEDGIKWIVNPYDEYAIEEALKIKESRPEVAITAISYGPERVDAVLRTALAMGVQHAVHIIGESNTDPLITAATLAAAIRSEGMPDLILMGKEAIDDNAYQVHLLLAEMLQLPAASNVVKSQYQDENIVVLREIDGGAKEKIEIIKPCLIAVTKGINTPRYASLMGIMKAKKIEIKRIPAGDFAAELPPAGIILKKLAFPPEKPQGRIIDGSPAAAVSELVRLLREEAKVI